MLIGSRVFYGNILFWIINLEEYIYIFTDDFTTVYRRIDSMEDMSMCNVYLILHNTSTRYCFTPSYCKIEIFTLEFANVHISKVIALIWYILVRTQEIVFRNVIAHWSYPGCSQMSKLWYLLTITIWIA